jgi:hypothetical protein
MIKAPFWAGHPGTLTDGFTNRIPQVDDRLVLFAKPDRIAKRIK